MQYKKERRYLKIIYCSRFGCFDFECGVVLTIGI
jgi:hypothetical protein